MIKLVNNILFCIVFCQLFFAQNLSVIENSNIVFVSYNSLAENVEKKVYRKGVNLESNYCGYNYYFVAANGNVDKAYPIRFFYFGPQATSQSKYIYYRVHKNFVRKNRDIIITKNFMCKIGKQKTREILNKAKAVFLIDEAEIEDCQILIKQVVFDDIVNE